MMRFTLRVALVAVTAAAMTATAGLGQMQTQPSRPAAFAQCSGCHAVEPGRTLFGPSLAGIAGRRAGSLEGYAYSGALRASGIRWDRASLDRWLAGPSAMVPGTRMPFRGISDPVARRQVVDYLMTLR